MKILLLGKNGQLGWELQRSLAVLGELTALDRHSRDYCGDLADLNGLAQTLTQLKPDIIVNAAAYTAVDKAETEVEQAFRINAEAPKILAEYAAQHSAWLIYYSSDYVFSGSGEQPWSETDQELPCNQYGKSKLAGEKAIQASGCKYLIFRTSWVYAARGNNFAKTMLRLAQERNRLSVIDDQIGAPTGADLLADVTGYAIRTVIEKPELQGVYHLVAQGGISWYEYAKLVLSQAEAREVKLGVFSEQLQAIASCEYPTPAQRPLNSRLNCQKLMVAFDLQLPRWESGVARMLQEMIL